VRTPGIPLIADLWEEIRPGDPDQGAGLLDARRGGAQVVVVRQGFRDQPLQHLILEDLPPGQVRQRGRLGDPHLAAVRLGQRDLGPEVIGANSTSCDKLTRAGEND
jgi:hypothetical protein